MGIVWKPDSFVSLHVFVVLCGAAVLSVAVHGAEADLPAGAALKWTVESENPAILAIAVNPDGQTIVTAGEDGEIRFWDAATGESKGHIDQHRDAVYSVVYSPDGSRFVTASMDESIQVWDAAQRRPERKFAWPASRLYPCNLAISRDGKKVFAASGPTIQAWATDTGEELTTIDVEEHNVVSITVSPDGSHLVSGDGYGNVHCWDVDTGRDLLKFDTLGTTVTYARNVPILAIRDPIGKLHIWKENSRLERTIDLTMKKSGSSTSYSGPVALSQDAQHVAVAVDETGINVFDLDSGSQRSHYEGHTERVSALGYLPDGSLVSAGLDGRVCVWNEPIR